MDKMTNQSQDAWDFEHIPRDADGLLEFSEDRAYNIDEESYDSRYKRRINLQQIDKQGRAFSEFASRYALNHDGPLLEVGCGTGRMTALVTASGVFDHLLVTDGSKAFTRITKRNMMTLAENGVGGNSKVDYGCLVDTNFSDLPDNYFGSISMYAVLHHFLDWRASLAAIRGKLVPGGTIFFGEPCYDFMMVSGVLSSAFAYFAEQAGIELNPQSKKSLRNMRNAAALRCSYQLEAKKPQEDKHAFRIDDIVGAGRDLGYEVTWLPNGTFADPEADSLEFRKTALHRFAVVNGFSEELMTQMSGFLDETLGYLARVGESKAGPYFDCLYVLRRI